MSRAGALLAGTCLVTTLTAAALAGSAGSAAAVAYSCSGDAAVDQAHLGPLLAAGGSITLRGPHRCVGNYMVSGVTVAVSGAGGGVTMDGGGTGSILVLDKATVTLSNLTLTRVCGQTARFVFSTSHLPIVGLMP